MGESFYILSQRIDAYMAYKEPRNKHHQNNQTNSAAAERAAPIDLEQINGSGFDFYSANSDYVGSTMVNKNQEIVNYRNSYTVRIRYN